eukprot:scaffold187995_cov28-Tisochrysis_lutea.AAC.2
MKQVGLTEEDLNDDMVVYARAPLDLLWRPLSVAGSACAATLPRCGPRGRGEARASGRGRARRRLRDQPASPHRRLGHNGAHGSRERCARSGAASPM